MKSDTILKMQANLGEDLRLLRLNQNISQARLAEYAGIGLKTLQNLESGQGGTLASFFGVLRALGREKWMDTLEPTQLVNPLTFTAQQTQRQRARRSTKNA